MVFGALVFEALEGEFGDVVGVEAEGFGELVGGEDGSEHGGFDGAGGDGEGADAEVFGLVVGFVGDGAGREVHACFGGGVGEEAGEGVEGADGGDVDDGAASGGGVWEIGAGLEEWPSFADGDERASQVDGEAGVEFGVGGFGDGFEGCDAGVVDEGVEAAEAFGGAGDHALGGAGFGEVGGVGEDVGLGGGREERAELVGGGGEACGIAGDENERPASLGEGLGDGEADACGAAGDECDGGGVGVGVVGCGHGCGGSLCSDRVIAGGCSGCGGVVCRPFVIGRTTLCVCV